ncbi:MAG: L-2-hydroxyglutarate oxidase [Gammaproteobacteria bacterium]
MVYDYVIIGGGIIGLSTAMALTRARAGASVLVLEKEPELACHQTGHNSGVIHSGIYYQPQSFKARFCREGARAMVAFCQQHGIKHEVCGKLILATESRELPLIEDLYQRGLKNGIAVTKVTPAEAREVEPHISCLAAIHVRSAGIVDFKQVSLTYAKLIEQNGGEIRLRTKAEGLKAKNGQLEIETNADPIRARFLINCGGLHSDRIARSANAGLNARIVPFRGEYYELKSDKRHLVRNLIYPVPDPDFPFLGVHFTRMIDGTVHAGPNAVLSFKREGYRKTDFELRDALESISYPGFWRLSARHWSEGLRELWRSLSKKAFTRCLQKLIPEVQEQDLMPTHAGVRAQALTADGRLVDDFLVVKAENSIHVCNAPSPAATSSLLIGEHIASQILG